MPISAEQMHHVTEMFPKQAVVWALVLLLTTMLCCHGCPGTCVCPEPTNEVECISGNLTAIPRDLPRMATRLDFTNNFIDRILSVEMAGFRRLLTLNFENNMIQNVQDGAFAELESLQLLDLSHNRLSIVTQQTLAGISHITSLDLSNNLIQHIDGTFTRMVHLTRIDLSYNQVTRITQVSFRELRKLRYLMLSDNQISSIDRRAFRTLDDLVYLVLRGNPIHRVSKYEFNSGALSYVDFSECGLEQIPRGLPATIRYFQLRKNNLTSLHRRSFRDCPHVSILVLDENGLVAIDDRAFEDMPYLQQIWLNGNRLTHVPHPLPVGLQRLLLDQNNIRQLENVFPVDSELRKLSLMGNNLTYLAYDALANLGRLESLDLSENNVSHIYGHTFIHQPSLTTLQLNKNPLSHLHGRSLWGLTNLTVLSLAYISTHVSMHRDVFSHITSLRQLSLDSSPRLVHTLLAGGDSLIRTLTTLQELSLQNCELTHLNPHFPSWFPNLTKLHISSSRWHCDTSMLWFRDWLLSTQVEIVNRDQITCFTPRKTHGRSLSSLRDEEFVAATKSPTTASTSPRPLSTFATGVTTKRSSTNRLKSTAQTSDSGHSGGGKHRLKTTSQIPPSDPPSPSPSASDRSPHLPSTPSVSHAPRHHYTIDWQLPPLGGDHRSQHHMTPEDWDQLYQPIQPPGQSSTLGADTQGPGDRLADSSHDPSSHTKTVIIVAVTLSTVVIASVIITFIVYFLRKQNGSHAGEEKSKEGAYQNGSIKYKHKNDVLYFLPNGGTKQPDSCSESVKSGSTSKEQMSLIPGRDINHEGPLRVYKWEDF